MIFSFFRQNFKIGNSEFFFSAQKLENFFSKFQIFLMPRAKIRIGKEQKSESFQKTNFLLFGVGIKVGRA